MVQPSDEGCPDGFVYAFRQTWQGTAPGCDCNKDGSESLELITKGLCTYRETLSGCSDINPEESVKMPILDGKILCKKIYDGPAFYQLSRPNMFGNCDPGFKICGPPSNIDFQYCYKD
jgi:hypothetical protein